MPLTRLDDVPWSALTHAYGSAEDVPDLLRALGAPDADTRECAWHDLHGSIWRQGSIYEATSHALKPRATTG